MNITAAQVKELRDATNAGMMDCKKALIAAEGDFDAAIRHLRERGVEIAGKKAGRAANQGLISAKISDDGKSGSMIMVNCETDFVARNDSFKAFVAELTDRSMDVDTGALADAVAEELTAKIAEIGENLVVAENARYTVDGTGSIHSYIHTGGSVGVLVEFGFENEATGGNEALQQLGRDVAIHIVASNPDAITRDELDPAKVEEERAIYTKEMEGGGKPADIIGKIVEGKINKYYSQVCLLDQAYVKEPSTTVGKLIEATGKELGDTLTVKRFTRWQIGG